jgi:hypothetical protein
MPEIIYPTVFPGWRIEIIRKGFLSKFWKVLLYDGFSVGLSTPYMLKSDAEEFAQRLLEKVCIGHLEHMKKEQPKMFAEILLSRNIMWQTEAMGRIPISKIAQLFYQLE